MRRVVWMLLGLLSAVAASCCAEDAKLYAQWALENSLENTAGAVRLNPYGGGKKLAACEASFADGAAVLGDITLFGTPDLDVAEGITVTGWIKPHEIEEGFGATAPHTLIYFYDSTNRSETQFVFRILDGKLGAFNATPAQNIYSSFAAPVDEWSFFAFVLNQDAVDIYLNEYPPQTTAMNSRFRYDRIYIGAMNTKLLRPYRGQIKNVRLYKGVLKAEDVRDIYKSEK